MSRQEREQQLLESLFMFFNSELSDIFVSLPPQNMTNLSEAVEILRPYFVLPSHGRGCHHIRIIHHMYLTESYDARVFEKFGLGEFAKKDVLKAVPSSVIEMAEYVSCAAQAHMFLKSRPHSEIAFYYRKLEEELDRWRSLSFGRLGPPADMFAFFNELKCDARYAHWRQMAVWTSEECVALSMGKDPSLVNLETLQGARTGPLHSPFRERFRSRLDIMRRAHLAGQIDSHAPPSSFVTWACKLGWEMPDELIAIASAESKATAASAVDDLERLEPSASTVYRLLLGMAISRFEHRTDRNSMATAMIHEDLLDLQRRDNAGSGTLGKIAVGNDTIRKTLQAAAIHLDAHWSESIKWSGVRRPSSA